MFKYAWNLREYVQEYHGEAGAILSCPLEGRFMDMEQSEINPCMQHHLVLRRFASISRHVETCEREV